MGPEAAVFGGPGDDPSRLLPLRRYPSCMEYDDQLDRAMERTPDIEEGGSRFEIPSTEVRTEGHETVFENFQDVVSRLNRDEEHVLKFLQSELGTSAGIDESGRSRLKGDFKQHRVEKAIDEYADAFVICPECGLPDTSLETEQGTKVLRCTACGALSPTGE